MSAEKMVANRKGLGGPQAESVRGMLVRLAARARA